MLAMRSEINLEGFSQRVSGANEIEFGNFTRKSVDLEDKRQSNSVKRIALPLRRVVFIACEILRSDGAGELSAQKLPTVP